MAADPERDTKFPNFYLNHLIIMCNAYFLGFGGMQNYFLNYFSELLLNMIITIRRF